MIYMLILGSFSLVLGLLLTTPYLQCLGIWLSVSRAPTFWFISPRPFGQDYIEREQRPSDSFAEDLVSHFLDEAGRRFQNHIWLCVKTNGIILGRCTTHFRTYFSRDWDVSWGYGVLTHGHMFVLLIGVV